MMKILRISTLLLSIVWSGFSYAGFMAISTGYDFFGTEEMSAHNSQAIGSGFQIEVGGHTRSLIASVFLKKSNPKGNVLHDDQKFALSHEITTIGFKASFMITRKTYGIVGFAINKHSSSFSKASTYDRAALYKAYDLSASQESDGMFFGVGRNFNRGRSFSFYGEYLLQSLTSGPKGKNHSLVLGVRFKVDLNI